MWCMTCATCHFLNGGRTIPSYGHRTIAQSPLSKKNVCVFVAKKLKYYSPPLKLKKKISTGKKLYTCHVQRECPKFNFKKH